jgi:hypothetical protein
MTQKNDYARLCQELGTRVLDSWQEYTLLRLPIHDDPSHAALWLGPSIVDGLEATYVLKTTCPSSGKIYAVRVPPNLYSAKEAASWIDQGINSEHSAVKRMINVLCEYQPEITTIPDSDYWDVHCCSDEESSEF